MLEDNMKTKLWALPIVAFVTLSVAARADSRIEKTLNLAPGGEFILEADAGSVTVTGSSASGAKVVVTSGRDDLQSLFNFNFEASPGMARVTARKNFGSFFHWPSHLNLHFEISVPKQTRLDIKTGGGSVEASTLQGEQSLKTSGGSIEANDIHGNLVARTSGGSVRVRDVSGDADVETSGGSIEVESLGGSLEAHTSGGPIRIDGVGGHVSAHTSGGSVHAAFARGDSQGGELETSGGSIEVRLDPSANLDIDAATSGGSVSSDLSLRVQGTISSSHLHATLGSGGQTLRLRTSGGSIRISSS
jgi:DUF4097 and DUF4098 domain-containing protein YvlB